MDIQAIPYFCAFYWFFLCWFLLFIHFSMLQPLSWKVMFSGTQKPTPPTVFNLEASDWVRCEEEAGSYYKLSWFTYKLIKKNQIFKVYLAPPKICVFQKISLKFIIHFFFKKRWLGIRIYVLNAMITSKLLYI